MNYLAHALLAGDHPADRIGGVIGDFVKGPLDPLPAGLRAGDPVEILSAGAYTTSYSSVGFNGIEPLRTYHLPTTPNGEEDVISRDCGR